MKDCESGLKFEFQGLKAIYLLSKSGWKHRSGGLEITW